MALDGGSYVGQNKSQMQHSASRTGALTSREPGVLRVTAAQLVSGDPLGTVLVRFSDQDIWWVSVIAFLAYGVLCLGAGFGISVFYQRSGYQFVSMLDIRELPQAVFVYLVAAPVIWTLYAGQPRWILQVFEQLVQNGVIGEIDEETAVDTFIEEQLTAPLRKAWKSAIAGCVALGGLLLVVLTAYPTYYRPLLGLPASFGFGTMWFLLNPVYFWVLWVPLVLFLPLYLVTWLVIRQVHAVWSFWRVFKVFELDPKLFHPDGCNGVGSVGDYAMRAASAAVFYGFWLLWMISFPRLFGEPIRLDYTTGVPLIVYAIAVPILLVPPVWGAFLAMRKAKSEALEAVGRQIRTVLSETDGALLSETEAERVSVSLSLTEQLERKYRLIDRELSARPFNTKSLSRFSIAAIIPLLSAVASILADVYLARTSGP